MKTKSQSSIEFLVLASVMFLFFLGLFAVISQQMVDMNEVRNQREVEDIIEIVKSEFQIAQTSIDGYNRIFYLPPSINGREYDMGLIDDTLVILYQGKRYDAFMPAELLPDTNVYKGANYVMKTDGMIFVNSSDPCNQLVEGDKSYCLAGKCYCYIGYYDEHCDESLYPPETPDGKLEDDYIVDHCGDYSLVDPGAINCVQPDPCNFPPLITYGPFAIATDHNATINFTSNEGLRRAFVSYDIVNNPAECDNAKTLTNHSKDFGPFSVGSLGKVDLDFLLPETIYCFNVSIYDTKNTPNSSDMFVFETGTDVTPPQILAVHFTPESLFLGSTFNISVQLFEPSGLYSDSRIVVNRSLTKFSREYKFVYDNDGDNYTNSFTVELADLTDERNFTDINASYNFEYGSSSFYQSFNNGTLYADSSEGSNVPFFTVQPDLVKGRFHNGVEIASANDCLKYETTGNFNIDHGTVEFFFAPNWDEADTASRILFHEGYTSGEMWVEKTTTGDLVFSVKSPTSLYSVKKDNLDWQAGKWYFVAAVWDFGLSPYIKLYLDGEEEDSVLDETLAVLSISDVSPDFNIGCGRLGSFVSNSVIDQFRISKIAFDEEAILSHMSYLRHYYVDFYLTDSLNEIYIPFVYPPEIEFDINYTDEP